MDNWRHEMIRPPDLKPGDRVFISSVTWSMKDTEPIPYRVTKVNHKWIYAKSGNGRKKKISQDTWMRKTQFGFGTDYMMLKISDYWDESNISKMKVLGSIHRKEYWSPLSRSYLDSIGK